MSRWAWISICVAGLLAGHDVATAAAQPMAIVLTEGAEISLSGAPHALVPRGSITAFDAAAGRIDAKLIAPGAAATAALTPDNELWMPLLLRNPAKTAALWQLQFVLASLDEVTLFDARESGWVESSAGDRVALSSWPLQGRYPRFGLRLAAGESRQVFVRVRNGFAAPLPARMIEAEAARAKEERVGAGLGVVLGTLLLLVAASLVQAVVYRETGYFLYAAFALLLGIAFASLSGLAGLHLWGDHPDWSDAAKSVFPLAGAGVSVWLVRSLCRVRMRARALAAASAAAGGAVIALALGFAVLRTAVPWLAAIGMLVAASTVLTIAVWAWLRGDPMGAWVFAAHTPLIGVTALILLRMFGIVPFEFGTNVLLSGAIGAILPLMLVALHLRSKELLAVLTRSRDMSSIDPLTGLLSQRLFEERVRAAIMRYRRSRHDAVVLCVRVTNYPAVRETHGGAVAEQTMIRAAMKIRRLMADADSIGRVNESTIGLIVETVTARAALMERASRLVAHGLMPLKGLKPEITLNLHVVAAVVSENTMEAARLQAALEALLASMSTRTRRPIRFLEAGGSPLAGVEANAPDGEAMSA